MKIIKSIKHWHRVDPEGTWIVLSLIAIGIAIYYTLKFIYL